MDSQHEFKMPSIIPQDLRLIQDLIGDEILKPPPVNTTALATAIPIKIKSDEDSSDDEDDSDSEKEVEANILADLDDEEDADQKSVRHTSFFSRLLNKSQNLDYLLQNPHLIPSPWIHLPTLILLATRTKTRTNPKADLRKMSL